MRDLRKALSLADQQLAAQAQRSDGVREQVMERITHAQQRTGWSNSAMLMAAMAGAALTLIMMQLWPSSGPVPVADRAAPVRKIERAGGATPRAQRSPSTAPSAAPTVEDPWQDSPSRNPSKSSPNKRLKRIHPTLEDPFFDDRSDPSTAPPRPTAAPTPAPSAQQDDAHPELRSDDPEQNGTLVAIAIGGSCDFTVDGKLLKTGVSSLRLKVMVGVHEVSCFNAGKMKRQSVTVSHDKPGIASFRVEPSDTLPRRGSEMFDHGF